MNALRFLMAFLLTLALLLSAPPSPAADETSAHRPGLRDQWQPQTEHDPRLAQPVHIEILGRAAVPTLEMLSRQTGVSLSVAPESLETVGERKLTIIAQGCSLKSIMVQIPNALQECHWDVGPQRGRPAYLLHRDSGTGAAPIGSAQEEEAPREDATLARAARIEEARKALAMSPEQLAALADTDPLLAITVRDPLARQQLEAFLALPPENLTEFIASGGTAVTYASAPGRLRASARAALQAGMEEFAREGRQQDSTIQGMIDRMAEASFIYRQVWPTEAPNDQVDLRISFPMEGGGTVNWDVLVLPSRLPQQKGSYQLRALVRRVGTPDGRSADAFVDDLWEQSAQQAKERAKRRQERAWREPSSPQLHKAIVLPFEAEADPLEVQRLIAKETGLSLISDYYAWVVPMPVPAEAKTKLPIWRLLYVLGERWRWTYEWHEVGDCLVFHYLPAEWMPSNPSPAFLRAAEVLRPVALDPPDARYAATYPAAYEFFGSFSDEQIEQFVAGKPGGETKELLLPVASLSPEQRRAFDAWTKAWGKAQGQDYLAMLSASGADPDLSNVRVGFVASDGTVSVASQIRMPDGGEDSFCSAFARLPDPEEGN
jgi:hypothetical protein